MVDKVALEEAWFREIRLSSVVIIPPILHTDHKDKRAKPSNKPMPFRIWGITEQKNTFTLYLLSDTLRFTITQSHYPTHAAKVKPFQLSKCR
jgi:hypothetical protein